MDFAKNTVLRYFLIVPCGTIIHFVKGGICYKN